MGYKDASCLIKTLTQPMKNQLKTAYSENRFPYMECLMSAKLVNEMEKATLNVGQCSRSTTRARQVRNIKVSFSQKKVVSKITQQD